MNTHNGQWPFPSTSKPVPLDAVSSTVRRLSAAESVARQLEILLDAIAARADVRDGSDGQQLPNEAMQLQVLHEDHARAALAAWRRA